MLVNVLLDEGEVDAASAAADGAASQEQRLRLADAVAPSRRLMLSPCTSRPSSRCGH